MALLKVISGAYLSKRFSSRNILKLRERGFYNDIFPKNCANEIVDLCNCQPQAVYAGFDPTAKCLHVGNLLVLVALLHWQRGGHQPIALVGGATARIGDPSGRTKEREVLESDTVKANLTEIRKCIKRVFENHEKYFHRSDKPLKPVIICDNSEWYEKMNPVDFLCTIGRNFRMGTMLSRTSVQTRINSETGMSFSEFTYQIFQAYDWYHLFKTHNCTFQLGGSDQMGNIMSGQELISRQSNTQVYGLTLPLIKSESGDKYGKSVGNAVWLDPEMTSPFELYQFFLRTPDSEVENLLKLFTFLPLNEIEQLFTKHMRHPEERLAQRVLAENVTLLIHGEEGSDVAKKTTSAMYGADIETLAKMSLEEIQKTFKGAPQIQVLLQPGVTVMELALTAKCFLSQKDAERIIKAGGFYLNQLRAKNPSEVLVQGTHILPNNVTLARVGKKNYWIIRWIS